MAQAEAAPKTFQLLETTIADVHAAFAAGELTARQLVEMYLERIEAYDRNGPKINSIISVSPTALAEADALDAAYRASGPVGPLHGIPIILKDQMDAKGMPTTLGSALFKDFYPDRDSTVTARLKDAGAIILAKATLGELGGGDTHGTLFGSTRNPYDPERTVGGSSGGSSAAASANFSTVCIGQEGFASIRRPSAWNSIVGMRPTAGLVSRGHVYAGWPSRNGSLGPMCRTVTDLAVLLDVMVGYDPLDPITAHGVGHKPASYQAFLEADGLRGARIGIIREPMGEGTDTAAEDYQQIDAVFAKAVADLAAAGATIVDPVSIPGLQDLIAKRAGDGSDDSYLEYMQGIPNPPFATPTDMKAHPEYGNILRFKRSGSTAATAGGTGRQAFAEYQLAREELMTRLLKVMADNELDAIVHKTVEHAPTLISEGVNPPYVNHKGAPHLNTFLIYVPSITVPAGFTAAGLPAGITFLGRPYSDASMVRFAYAYEQATMNRVPPAL